MVMTHLSGPDHYFVRFTQLLKQIININLFDYFKAEWKHLCTKCMYLRQLRVGFYQGLNMNNAVCTLSHRAL